MTASPSTFERVEAGADLFGIAGAAGYFADQFTFVHRRQALIIIGMSSISVSLDCFSS